MLEENAHHARLHIVWNKMQAWCKMAKPRFEKKIVGMRGTHKKPKCPHGGCMKPLKNATDHIFKPYIQDETSNSHFSHKWVPKYSMRYMKLINFEIGIWIWTEILIWRNKFLKKWKKSKKIWQIFPSFLWSSRGN